jgi:hypothetical protein
MVIFFWWMNEKMGMALPPELSSCDSVTRIVH